MPAGRARRRGISSGDDPEGLAAVGNVADGTAKEKYPDWMDTIAARDGYVYTAPVGRFRPMRGACTTCTAMSGSGARTGTGADYYKQSPVDDPPGPWGPRPGCSAAGAGTIEPARCRSAFRGRPPGHRTTTWASAWP